MMLSIVAWSSRHYRIVFVTALALAMLGALARRALPRAALPDLSDPQIVLVADWMGHPAVEVSSRITRVLTGRLPSVPGVTAVRGTSMSGMAYVAVVFDAPARLAEGRTEIVKRVQALRRELPKSMRLQVGPLGSSTSWVFEYALVDPRHRTSQLELRHFQDDVLGPALAVIPGVAEVAPLGGSVQQLSVEVSPDLLRTRGAAFTDVLGAIEPALAAGKQPSLEELQTLPLGPAIAGPQARLSDVAYARITPDMPSGLADLGGMFRAVGGIVLAERSADLPALIGQVRHTLDQKRKQLPRGVELVTVYDRSELVRRVDQTLFLALSEEVAVVVLVILAFLLHGPSALVPLLTLPLVLLLTFAGMWMFSLPASLMSLGGIGIALGIAVDADVVALEACHRRLEALGDQASRAERRQQIVAAASAFAPAILTSLVITGVSFLPIFAFGGESARLLGPLALAKTLVIAAAALVTLTLAPALRAALLDGRVIPEFHNPLTRGVVRVYRPFVHFALSRPFLTLSTAAVAVASCLPLLPRLGREFLPRIEEGDLLFMPTTLPGVPVTQALNQLHAQDRAIGAFKEVATVFGKIGRADTATDPAPYSMAETTIRLRPRSEWPKRARLRWYSRWAPAGVRHVLGFFWPESSAASMTELVEQLDQATRLPGWVSAWTAPARARMDMMSTGFRTPIGLRILAQSPERLDALGAGVRSVLTRVPGTRSVVYESLGGETRLEFAADAAALARHEVDPELVRATSELLLTGGQLGEYQQGNRRLRLRILPSVADSTRGAADQLRDVTVRSSPNGSGPPVPLNLLGRPTYAALPAALRTERGRLVGYVHVDLAEGADLSGYVQRSQGELDHAQGTRELSLRPDERLEWAGQYALLASGERRLKWIVPIVLGSMLGLLYLQFRSLVEALIVLVSVPFALVGSVWALFLLGYPLSAPVWVGLLSVLGLAMQTGVVMVVYIDDAFHRRVREGKLRTREDIVLAHAEGTVQRLRPKLMTISTMAAGLLPLLWADGAGSEIIRRVAAPMIGGLFTSAFLTLEVLPVLYTIWRHRQLRRAQRKGVSIEAIVGPAPAWARR